MAAAQYIELHAHSAFSFLDGASTPMELAARAAALDYPALALTDHDGLWGSMEFAHACKGYGLKPITGAELTVALTADDEPELAHLTLMVEDATGYRNLCRLLTAAHSHTRDGAQRTAGQPSVPFDAVLDHAEGLVCLSGCARDGALAGRFERGERARAPQLGGRLLAAFGRDRLRVELQRPYERADRARNRWLAGLAEQLGVPTVASGNVHFHSRARSRLQDAFVAVREGVGLEGSEPLRRGNRSAALASPAGMAARFAEHPEAVAETVRLAERLEFDLTHDLGYHYPGSEDADANHRLAEICRALLAERYACSADRQKAEQRLEGELGVIRHLRLAGFFLLHRDLLELAREVALEVRGPDSARSVLPPGRGRGSSVSSIVCYLTGLSHIDPVKADLFAGRFLNSEATSMPDIDLDFPRDIREKLIPRVHERYGSEHSALVAAFPTYRPRGAVRDLGKALGLPAGEIERGGIYRGVAEIAARSGVSRDGLERLAWAGALDHLPLGGKRRENYWRLGVAGASAVGEDGQLHLSMEPPPAPELESLDRWEKIIEDYRSTGVNLGEHPLALLRGGLGEAVLRSSDLDRVDDGTGVEVAGMVVARQRPETARGITFLLLEDECGTVNLIVPSRVYEGSREVVRAAPLMHAQGRLERREGVVNVLVAKLEALQWSGGPGADVLRIEPGPAADPASVGTDDLAARRRARELAVAELRAVVPAGHSFGRRGR